MPELRIRELVKPTTRGDAEISPDIFARSKIEFLNGTRAWLESFKRKYFKIIQLQYLKKKKKKIITMLPSSGFSLVILAAITCPQG